jgi:hypothetical protein
MKAIGVTLGVLVVSVGFLGWLTLSQHVYEPLVPEPESVVQQFVRELSANRYGPATQTLAPELERRLPESALRSLNEALQRRFGAYRFELGGEVEQDGDHARYQAEIATERMGIQHIHFDLQRDGQTGLWRIISLDELVRAGQTP